jgi:predicted enzyme related to lactoylglutathione lyase
MATRTSKTGKKKTSKKSTKKASKKVSAKRVKRPARAAKKAPVRKIRDGVITHTELASADPEATKAWCTKVLGWKFGPPMQGSNGPYHMWQFAMGTGGGIRTNNPPEVPGSIPYCEVTSIKATFDKALANGATEMLAPAQLPAGMGWIAIVAAPGGVAIGFWAMK